MFEPRADAERSSLRIVPSRPEELAALCELCVRALRVRCAADYTPAQLDYLCAEKEPELFARWLESPDSRFFSAHWDGRPVGVAMIHRSGWLGLLYVDPDFGGRGIAAALLEAAEEGARAWEMPLLNVKSTLTSRSYYEQQGYLNLGLDEDGTVEGAPLPAYWLAKAL